MSVLSLPDLKAHLNITGTTHDGELSSLILAAEATITHHVGPLEPTTVTVRIDGGGSVLLLPVWPVLSLTSVTDSAGTAVTIADLYLDTAAGLVTYNSGARFGSRYYTVTYQAGRATCPPDLLLAVKELARHLWASQRSPALYPGSTVSEGPGTTPGAAYLMPYRVQELLAPHMQVGIA